MRHISRHVYRPAHYNTRSTHGRKSQLRHLVNISRGSSRCCSLDNTTQFRPTFRHCSGRVVRWGYLSEQRGSFADDDRCLQVPVQLYATTPFRSVWVSYTLFFCMPVQDTGSRSRINTSIRKDDGLHLYVQISNSIRKSNHWYKTGSGNHKQGNRK
jgi:hypothetical protein